MGEYAIFGGVEQFQFMFPFTTSFLAWIPAVNALSTMLLINCYRKSVRNFLGNSLCHIGGRLKCKTASDAAVTPLPSTI